MVLQRCCFPLHLPARLHASLLVSCRAPPPHGHGARRCPHVAAASLPASHRRPRRAWSHLLPLRTNVNDYCRRGSDKYPYNKCTSTAVSVPPSLMLEHARLRRLAKYHDAPDEFGFDKSDVALVQLRCRDRDRRDRPCKAMPSTSTGDLNIYEPCTTTAAVILTRNVYHYRREYLYRRHVPLLPLPSQEKLLPL